MKTGICKVCGSDKTSMTMIGGSKFKWCHACGQTDIIQTNADRIRTMNDEELKKFIVSISNPIAFSYVTGEDIVMKWLKQEVEQ